MNRNLFKQLVILSTTLILSTSSGSFAGFMVATASFGLKKSILGKPEDASLRRSFCRSVALIAMSMDEQGTDQSITMGAAQADLSLLCVYDMFDWLRPGMLLSIGVGLDRNVENKTLTVPEAFNLKLGVTLMYFHIVSSLGIRFGTRTTELETGKLYYGSEKFQADNSWGVGWFHQTMILIPLPNDEWKVVLFGEVHGDVKDAEVKAKDPGQSDMYKLENLQAGFKLGIGVAYTLFGSI